VKEDLVSNPYLLAIDQGTTSTRAVVFDDAGRNVASSGLELTQHYPYPGWVEHDAEEVWRGVRQTVPAALQAAGIDASQLAAIGITNQRETCLFWDRTSGKPSGRAIVWQDRRTADFCRDRRADADWLHQKTGLILDPYFAGTKLHWMLKDDAGLRKDAVAGSVAAGTVDSFLIWRLTGGRLHATDVTNASRTLLLNLATAEWDDELCQYFGVPRNVLPEVRPSAGDFGTTRGLDFLPDGIPIRGVAGDQQAALFGQCGFSRGEAKCTYGTGAFFLQHVGDEPVLSRHRLVTSIAATTGRKLQYVLEGSIFIAGAAVQWLRDGLKLIPSSPEVEALAEASDPNQPVLFVPAFVGLGAPHWVPEARGVLFGLTRGTTSADLARAALEGVAYQVADLVEAAAEDTGAPLLGLRVDGGMARNAWFLRRQADVLGLPVLAEPDTEATARGAAYLAGLAGNVWPDLEALRRLGGAGVTYAPSMSEEERERRMRLWHRAVRTVIAFYHEE
jgi:glycerol kinase